MNTLEISLSVTLALVTWLLIRMYRKQLIIRHLFIHSSDWCARKIDEMTDSATCCIVELAKTNAASDGWDITEDDALGLIPCVILDAKKEWMEQKSEFQNRLSQNGISPLAIGDLDDPILNPGLAGLK